MVKFPQRVGRLASETISTRESVFTRYLMISSMVMMGMENFSEKIDQVGHAGHGAVFLHDLADHPGRVEAGDLGQVDRGLGLAGAHQHAAVPGAQGENMAGARQVLGAGLGIDQSLDGDRPVVGRDAGGGIVLGVDRDGERGLEMGGVVVDHQRQVELLAALFGHGDADQPARLLGHEVDRSRG